MRVEESQYIGYDGERLFLTAWLPDRDKPRALLVALHGLGSHGQALKNIGEYFCERGLAVLAPDLRGFGHNPAPKGHVMRFMEYVEDIHNLVRMARDHYRSDILFLFGHSMGGLVAILTALHYQRDLDGLVLSCPAVSQRLPVPSWKRVAGEILSLLNVRRYFSSGISFEYASHDPRVAEAHARDPLRFDMVTPRFGIEGLRATSRGMRAASMITLPTLVQQAGDDRYVDPERTKKFFDQLASGDKTFKFYEGLYHELHSEIDKDQVLHDMMEWLERRIPA
ncbi:MAG: alpha/beta hydrolase [Candidatus Thorarchaeota archaeon]